MPQHPTAGPRAAHVGGNVRRQREKKKMTQAQLADRLGWSQQIIAKLELGRTGMRVEQLVDIAEALDVKPALLLRGVTEVPR